MSAHPYDICCFGQLELEIRDHELQHTMESKVILDILSHL